MKRTCIIFLSILFGIGSCCPEKTARVKEVTHIETKQTRGNTLIAMSSIDVSYTDDHQISSYYEHFTRYFDGDHSEDRLFSYTFQYFDNRCEITRQVDNDSHLDIYLFNPDRTLNKSTLWDGSTISFSYDNGHLSAMEDILYTWEDSNIASITDKSGHQYILEYYDFQNPFQLRTDWTIDIGGILPGDPFGYGFLGPRNANLIKSVSGNGLVFRWEYEFESAGNISGFQRYFSSEDYPEEDILDVKLTYTDSLK